MGERDLNGFHKSMLMIHSPRLTSIRQLDRTSYWTGPRSTYKHLPMYQVGISMWVLRPWQPPFGVEPISGVQLSSKALLYSRLMQGSRWKLSVRTIGWLCHLYCCSLLRSTHCLESCISIPWAIFSILGDGYDYVPAPSSPLPSLPSGQC
jgi:hypothetical protein